MRSSSGIISSWCRVPHHTFSLPADIEPCLSSILTGCLCVWVHGNLWLKIHQNSRPSQLLQTARSSRQYNDPKCMQIVWNVCKMNVNISSDKCFGTVKMWCFQRGSNQWWTYTWHRTLVSEGFRAIPNIILANFSMFSLFTCISIYIWSSPNIVSVHWICTCCSKGLWFSFQSHSRRTQDRPKFKLKKGAKSAIL